MARYAKYPDEEFTISIDFSEVLSDGETINEGESDVEIFDSSNNDVTSTMLTSFSASGDYIYPIVKAGTAGNEYKIVVLAKTSSSQTFQKDVYCFVRSGTHYADLDEAAKLSGVNTDDIPDIIQNLVDGHIDVNIRKAGFYTVEDCEEYYDILRERQTDLILVNHPVLAITLVKDNMRSSSPTTLSSDSYVIDFKSGILQLSPMNDDLTAEISYFTKGFQSVYVKYNYGYATVPIIIKNLSTLLLAKWAKIQNQDSSIGTALKSVKIGDYSESYDLSFMNIKSEFDNMIDDFWKQAKQIYSSGV